MVTRPVYHGRANEPPTVSRVLGFPSLRRGDPVVVGGAAGLENPVRWVHVSEFEGIGSLLHGGEVLLTMGSAIPADAAGQAAYVDRLADANAAALVVGLGPHFDDTLPNAVIEAGDRRGLPIVVLRRTIAFIDVTEEVHAALVDRQVRELQAMESIHTMFNTLALEGSRPEIVLRQVAKLAAAAVVLEDRSHQLIGFDPCDRTADDVLSEWMEHTRRVTGRDTRTSYDPVTGWLQTAVGARGNDWGRLVIMAGGAGVRESGRAPDPMLTVPPPLVVLIERAASTLALGRLVDRETQLLALNTHRSVLVGMLAGDDVDRDIEQEAVALGISFRRLPVLALALRDRKAEGRSPIERQRALRALGAAVADLLRGGPQAIVGPVDDLTIAALVPTDSTLTGAKQVAAIGRRLRAKDVAARIGYSGPVTGFQAARTALTEAIEVVTTAAALHLDAEAVSVGDLGLRGLLFALRDERRVRDFADRAIGTLVDHDREYDTNFVLLLRHYLHAGRNKSIAARNAYVSRPWMHERLRAIGALLDVDLNDEETCLSLQVALMIAEIAGLDARDDRSDPR